MVHGVAVAKSVRTYKILEIADGASMDVPYVVLSSSWEMVWGFWVVCLVHCEVDWLNTCKKILATNSWTESFHVLSKSSPTVCWSSVSGSPYCLTFHALRLCSSHLFPILFFFEYVPLSFSVKTELSSLIPVILSILISSPQLLLPLSFLQWLVDIFEEAVYIVVKGLGSGARLPGFHRRSATFLQAVWPCSSYFISMWLCFFIVNRNIY